MGSLCNESVSGYPDQQVLTKEWRDHISPWLRKLLQSVAFSSRDQAKAVFNSDLVDKLVCQADSAQKVFDMYGVAEFLFLLNEDQRRKELLVKLSQIVPYTAIYLEITAVCAKLNDYTARLEYLEKALEKNPAMPELLSDMGGILIKLNQRRRGLELMRKSARQLPDNAAVFSNYLCQCHYAEELDCDQLYSEHRDWAKINADADYIKDHKNDPDPDRKLRIGYISPDYRVHPVGILMNPVFVEHDRDQFDVFAYSNIQQWEAFTDEIKRNVDTYRIVTGVSSRKVVDMIKADKIDILIDLAGHTSNNRLDVMAYKPAPVQVSYLGYFDTTGMEQIDYFLTDCLMSPPESRKYYTEELFYLPGTCLSFNNLMKWPDVADSPFRKNGYMTFGMYSNPVKINGKIARLWGQILEKTTNSRLKILLRGGKSRDVISIYLKLLKDSGVEIDRVDILGEKTLGEYMSAYNDVDIMLDTYPYNGGMTTCDAFWMGVPVVSLVGEHHFSRVGLSLLSAVGLEYFAAKTGAEYVAKACGLAGMPDALNKIRGSLRQRVSCSVLGNVQVQTRNIENAYRQMWRRWCGKGNQKV